jgi:hypothetical protein
MAVHAAPSAQNLLVGKGQVFFDRFDVNGVSTGFRHIGNVDKLEISTDSTKLQKFSAMSANAPLYSEVSTKRAVKLALTGSEFHPQNFALATTGNVADLVQAATAVTGEAAAAATVPGTYILTKKRGPVTGVAVHFGATLGVLGTDYAITNANVGLIQILPGTILTGAVTIDYTPTAYTAGNGIVVAGGAAGIIQGALKFVGDPTTGPAYLIEVWKCNVSPDGAMGLISDDFADLGLEMEVLDDSANHPAAPLFMATQIN